MFNFFSVSKKKQKHKKTNPIADLKQLDKDIEKTNEKIRSLYAKSKIAIMNNDMNTVRIAARVRSGLLDKIETLQSIRERTQV